jgi:hypothetical protein
LLSLSRNIAARFVKNKRFGFARRGRKKSGDVRFIWRQEKVGGAVWGSDHSFDVYRKSVFIINDERRPFPEFRMAENRHVGQTRE